MTWQKSEFWTEEKVAQAEQLFLVEGKSANQVAKLIGAKTRNMVIGLAYRRGWTRTRGTSEFNHSRHQARIAERRRKEAAAAQRESYRRLKAAKAKQAGPPREDAPTIEIALGGRLAIMNRFMPQDARPKTFMAALLADHCRWPIDPAGEHGHSDMMCCGADAEEGSSYCAFHVKRSGNGKSLGEIKVFEPNVIRRASTNLDPKELAA